MAHNFIHRRSLGPCCLSLLAVWLLASPAAGQSFDSGSDGSDGALLVDASIAIQVPPDGILNYTTVQVNTGQTLSFIPNALNTPVYILASGDVTIEGTVHVNGAAGTASLAGVGGPGGFRGGQPSPIAGQAGGAGLGPGAGAGRNSADSRYMHPGSYATSGTVFTGSVPGPTYGGSLLIPLVGGSGSGGGVNLGGGGGGGAILIASSSSIFVNGTVSARGGRVPGTYSPAGSGGAIRLVGRRVTGSGTVTAARNGQSSYNTYGGGGRVRIDRLVQGEVIPTVSSGHWVSSSLMLVFPDNLSKLHVTHVAGTDIAVDHPSPVTVFLSNGQSPTQSVTVNAVGFPGSSDVNINVVLAPTLGNVVTFPGTIPIGNDGTGQLTLSVDFPVNVVTHVQVWTAN